MTEIDFDDILLLPKYSNIDSRSNVDISVDLGGLKLSTPIIVSPMKGIINKEMCVALYEMGAIGILHRFYDPESTDWSRDLLYMVNKKANFGISVQLGDLDSVYTALDYDNVKIICVDTANGYLQSVLNFCWECKTALTKVNRTDILLMAGNVVTWLGCQDLADVGVDLIRVGIGGGHLCTTRNNTGVGRPQLSAVRECSWELYTDDDTPLPEIVSSGVWDIHAERRNWKVISDGGIRNSGDIVKAIAYGADAVMVGSLFGRTYESAHDGIIYGMASRRLQDEYYHEVKSVEGLEREQIKDISLAELLNELSWGIKSACTYLNSKNLSEIRNNAQSIYVGAGSIKKFGS